MAAGGRTGTYSGDPSTSDRDAVRFLIPDTDPPLLFSDLEIDYLLTSAGNVLLAAADACEQLTGRFAGDVDKRIGSLSVSGSQKVKQYLARAKELRKQYIKSGNVDIFVGGLSKSAKRTLKDDADAVQPHTEIGQDDHPGLTEDPDTFGRWSWP